MKVFTVQEIIDAMEQNGFPLNHEGAYLRDKKGKPSFGLLPIEQIGSACIWGQAAINLGVDPTELHNAATNAIRSDRPFLPSSVANIVSYNDGQMTKKQPSYQQILAYAKKALLPYKDQVITVGWTEGE